MNTRVTNTISAISLAGFMSLGTAWAGVTVDGVTFAVSPRIYAPVRELGEALGLRVEWNAEERRPSLGGRPLADTRSLLDGTRLMPIRNLEEYGATIRWDAEAGQAVVEAAGRTVSVPRGAKYAVVDKSSQELIAFQGDRELLRTRVSTGSMGRQTPNGTWEAGPYKARMHRSSLYDNAPMPWSVQVHGNYFIHGFHSVPEQPASAGCIRVPIDGQNPAKWFYEWIEIGTPVTIEGRWGG
jgi:hypothetical protein